VVAIAEGAGGEEDVRGAAAVEEGDAAAGAVGGAVVQVHEERGLAGVAGQDLEDDSSEDAAAGGIVGGVVGNGLGGGVRGDGEVLGAKVGGAEGGGLGPGGACRDAGGGDEVAVDEGGLVDGQVVEGEVLGKGAVSEGHKVDGVGAHLVAEVVEADLPADHVFDGLDHNLRGVSVNEVVASQGRETVLGGANRHAIVAADAWVRVGVAGGDHVDGEGGCLDGPSGEGSGKK
jgi:hypothetical protein